ncbi:site-specific recombinase, DNA invertase Pin-like protein [Rubidibacter lacunae KORDI 51-2]|uniref:Site-specific recombinase, DNA invertase Pin-like protein n=1 Tax=Rubidibacter lacunae KORDI 51-2 TaxID=582515 RepID=U5DP80_9CHRO|nr:recombinase family protein [Rubidibacter lacunae]ERN41510.1 site-specific recombinase, DNA invertase Pin-like protein [Rubidibacter lacunae KORDI 51-2]
MKAIAYSYRDPLLDSSTQSVLPSTQEIEIAGLYEDWGERSAWQQVLAACDCEPPACVLVRSPSELGTSAAEVDAAIAQLTLRGVALALLEPDGTVRKLPLGDRATRAAIAQWQDEQKRQQLLRGHARRRLQAQPPPGKAPYGYRRGRDRYGLDRSTAPVVKEFCDRFLLYGSLRGAVRYLEAKFGKKISVATGRRWLTHPVYRGDLLYKTGEIVPDAHIAILSRDEAAQIDRLMKRNRRLPPRAASAPHSLAGLVICSTCKQGLGIARVKGRNRQQAYLYLRAARCPRQPTCRSLPYQAVLDRAIVKICEELPPAIAQLQSPDTAALQVAIAAQVERKQQALAQLPVLEQQEILDADTAALRRARLHAEIAALYDRRAQLPPPNLSAIAREVALPQFWYDLSETERRFYLREFLRHIEVLRPESGVWELRLAFVF